LALFGSHHLCDTHREWLLLFVGRRCCCCCAIGYLQNESWMETGSAVRLERNPKGIELYNRTEQRRRPFSVLLCLLRSLLLLLLVGEIRKRRDILFLFSLFSWLLIERESGPEYFHVLGFNYLKRKGKE
jgi:hypothetical protein